jgi:hypothetical protein
VQPDGAYCQDDRRELVRFAHQLDLLGRVAKTGLSNGANPTVSSRSSLAM